MSSQEYLQISPPPLYKLLCQQGLLSALAGEISDIETLSVPRTDRKRKCDYQCLHEQSEGWTAGVVRLGNLRSIQTSIFHALIRRVSYQ